MGESYANGPNVYRSIENDEAWISIQSKYIHLCESYRKLHDDRVLFPEMRDNIKL